MVQYNSETSTVCIVRDTLPESTQGRMSLMVRPSYSVEQLFNDVATQFQYKPNEFELVLQATKDASHIVLNEQRDKTCGDVGVNFDEGARNTLIIGPLRSQSRRKAVYDEDDLVLGASASPTAPIGPPVAPSPLPALLPADSMANCLPMRDTSAGFVGLVNQAMTCYLNSLLQALYMTPEFRNALYNWQFDGSEETKSIPFQLQKLFLNLQTSTRSAIETTDLTKSFGWDSTEAWQQHDIQELCRVMFDALEQKFKKTKQADLINRLYEGKMIDYVRCLRCRVEKSREDTFLDIPLPVRPFGSSVAYNSVEEALRAFVQPETLDGNNQYHCDKCDTKCDAHKGLKFSRFPYLLTLHLKRFDFDYQTLHRIKLNDKVSFPETLNLNGFIGGIGEGNTESPEENSTGSSRAPEDRPCDDSSTTDSGSALDDECADKENHTNSSETDFQDYDEGIDMALSSGDRSIRSADRPGPYKYELFSIMIHSGSASGGHYYAYIKDFKTNQWFCFNDQSVLPITQEDIHKTYGGGPLKGYYSGAYTSSTNAYMLMYRQIDRQRNVQAIEVDEFPQHIKDLLIKLKDREETDRKMKEIEMGMCKIKLFCHHPSKRELVESKLYIFSDVSLEEATLEAYKRLNLEEVVPIDQCRLVTFDRTSDTIDRSFDDRQEDQIGEILTSTRHNYNEMLLEIRDPDKDFKIYKPGGVNTKVFYVDINTEEIEGPTMVRGNVSQTILEFKETIVEELMLNVKPESLHLVIEKYSNGPKLLEDNFKLKNECIHGQNKFFVSTALDSDPDKPFSISKLNKIIDRFEHVIMLHISLPDTSKETLETLAIPSYDPNQTTQNDSPTRNHVQTPTSQPPLNLRTNSPQHPTVATNPAGAGDTVDAVMLTGSPVPPLEGENSEDSSLSESDRTLVGDAPQETSYNMMSHDLNDDEVFDEDHTKIHYKTHYFKAVPYLDNNTKMLKVFIDKRMVVGSLKNCLQPSLGVPMEYFKLYRVYSANQECECTRLSESLGSFRDEERLSIRLGRALRKGEHRGKVFFLRENNPEHTVFICEWVLAGGTTVGQFKGDLLREKQIDIPFERCRLRKKNWKNPAKIYLDNMKFGDDIVLFSNWELYLQDLAPLPEINIEEAGVVNGLDHVEKDANIIQSNSVLINNNETKSSEVDSQNQIVYEKVTTTDQLVLFVKRWYPERLELGKFDEVVLIGVTIDELKEKIHEISNIPITQIEFAKAPNSFPCDMSVLSIHTELEWSPQTTSLDVWPLNVFEDGSVFFYRDRTEKLRDLTAEERREIVTKEGPRFGRYGATSTTHSPRREKALKIYLDNSPKKKDLID